MSAERPLSAQQPKEPPFVIRTVDLSGRAVAHGHAAAVSFHSWLRDEHSLFDRLMAKAGVLSASKVEAARPEATIIKL